MLMSIPSDNRNRSIATKPDDLRSLVVPRPTEEPDCHQSTWESANHCRRTKNTCLFPPLTFNHSSLWDGMDRSSAARRPPTSHTNTPCSDRNFGAMWSKRRTKSKPSLPPPARAFLGSRLYSRGRVRIVEDST